MSQPVFISPTPNDTNRTGRRFLSLILPIVIAAICLWMAMPHAAVSRGTGFQPANKTSSLTAPVSPNATPVSLPATPPELITLPIESIRPGMRVLADNPEETEALPDADVDPQHWRLVSLQMTKEDGGTLHVQLLRPVEWLVTELVILVGSSEDPYSLFARVPAMTAIDGTEDFKFQRLLLGQSIYLDLPELGALGPATVAAITPCPPIDPVVPGRRLVTGTFRHSAANIIDVQIGSESEPFGVTDNHPFWSVDRQQFVEAGQLEPGERLHCADSTITQVTRITPRRGPPVEVYNFEVDAVHVYHVDTSGVLVHNSCTALHHSLPKYLGGFVDQLKTRIPAGVHRQLHNMLRERWRNLGFPPEGGTTGSRAAWRSFFQGNPERQRVALDELLDVTREIDMQHGTNILSGLWNNIINGQFN